MVGVYVPTDPGLTDPDSADRVGWQYGTFFTKGQHMGTGQACVKKCIAGGEKPVFVDDASKKVYTIDDPAEVKDHYGHHVEVMGSVSASSIHIAKLTMLKDQGSSAAQGGMEDMH